MCVMTMRPYCLVERGPSIHAIFNCREATRICVAVLFPRCYHNTCVRECMPTGVVVEVGFRLKGRVRLGTVNPNTNK